MTVQSIVATIKKGFYDDCNSLKCHPIIHLLKQTVYTNK